MDLSFFVHFCINIALLPVCYCYLHRLIGVAGKSVTLPCKYNVRSHGVSEACWGKGEVPLSKCSNEIISTDGGAVKRRESQRYQLLGAVKEGDVSLTILNVTENDSGMYGCRVEINGWFNDQKHNFHLTIGKDPVWTPQWISTVSPTSSSTPDPVWTPQWISTVSPTSSSTPANWSNTQSEGSAGTSPQTTAKDRTGEHSYHLALVALMIGFLLLVFLSCKILQKHNLINCKAQQNNPSQRTAETEQQLAVAADNIYQLDT